jgi:PAS domain S-box-containing protein
MQASGPDHARDPSGNRVLAIDIAGGPPSIHGAMSYDSSVGLQHPAPHRRSDDRLLDLLSTMADELMNRPVGDIDAVVYRTLGGVGEMFGVARAYVFRFSPETDVMSNTHEWCSVGTSAQIGELQNVPTEGFPWWMTRMRAGRMIRLTSLEDLPAHATGEREILEPQGITSLLVLPMSFDGRLLGFVGFDHVRTSHAWTDTEVSMLRVCSAAFASAFERRSLERRLEMANLVFTHAREGMFTADQDGVVTEVNPACETITGIPAAKAVGMHASALVRPGATAAFAAALDRNLKLANHWSTEFVEQYAGRPPCPVWVSISASRGSDGTVQRLVAVFGRVGSESA